MVVFGGLGLAFFTEYLDHSFNKPEDILRKLELPVVAAIPFLPSQSLLLSGLPMPALQSMTNSFSSTRKKGHHNLLEYAGCSESLQECLIQAPGDTAHALCTLAVTSAHSGEGVSTVVSHIAGMLAGQGNGRVLIVDANLAHPGQHLKFGGKLSPGLADILSNGKVHAGVIQRSRVENIDLMAAGEGAVNLGRSAVQKSLADLLPAFRREYSHIIFDVPALQDNAAGAQLAGAMDGVILVVEAESTRWEVAQQARDRLLEASANVLGVILNKRRFYLPEWLYKTL
jgi:capsular exopolysaccharide synthesis family protein